MRRRSRAGGKSPNAQAPKTAARKSDIARESARRRSLAGTHETELARVIRERDEAREQQIATADVLKIISRSTFDLKEVLNTLTKSAARLCAGDKGLIFQRDGDVLRLVANLGHSREAEQYWLEHPLPVDSGSATGRAVLEGRAIHIPDVLADPKYQATRYQELSGYRSVLCVPLLRNGTTIGTFSLSRDEVTPFTDRQIKLVETFADQAVIAIENTRLFEAEQQRTRELTESLEQQTATSEVLQVISSSPGDLQPVFEAMLEKAVRICDARSGNIFRWDGNVLNLVATHGMPPAYAEMRSRLPFRPDSGNPTSRMLRSKTAIHGDLAQEKTYIERRDPATIAAVELAGIRTFLAVPMLKENELIGSFAVFRQEVQPFSDKQIELVTNFAAQAVIAIENARLLNELRQRTTDLTERTSDLTEALDQQTATSEVLQVISSSPGDLQPVFDAMLQKAVHICDAQFGNIYRWREGALHLVAAHNTPPALAEARRRLPLVPGQHPIIDRMVTTKAASHVIDAAATSEYIEHTNQGVIDVVELGGVRTALSVPMMRDNELIGSFTVYRQEVRPFTDKQIELVTNFAAQAVIAIENARLLNELRESLEQQTATSKVLDVISRSAFDLRAVFETVAESSVKLCGADRAFIFRFDGELLRLAASFNASQEIKDFVERNPIRLDRRSASGRAAIERRTIHIANITADPEYSYGATAIEPYRTLLGVPILKGDDLLGVIIVWHREVRPFTDKQIALVETFADQAAIAIENARLLDALRQRTDELGQSVGELRALGDVSQAVNSTLDLETVLSTIVAKAVQLSGTEAGAIYVFDELQSSLRLRATYGMDQELIDALTHQTIGMNEPYVAAVFAKREPLQVPDLREGAPSPVNEVILRAGFRAVLVTPLLRGEEIVGLLVVRRWSPGGFAQNIVDLIKTFAAQSAVAIENARLFQSVQTSLEDLRTTQDRLVQTQKLASLGQLTAGIAHEIKNPLNFVNNFSGVSSELIDELQETLKGASLDDGIRNGITELTQTLRANLDKIVQHGKRADAIVKNMLLHSREGSGEHRLVDVNALVEESLNLAYHGARAEKQGFKINIERSFDPTAGQVDVYPQEITRALLNLISNGFYAATKRKEQDKSDGYEPTVMAATKNFGDKVEIRIRDSGTGMRPEVKEKMFNPFFTTKPAGEGTGLGLSITHDIIVKQHSGSIEVDTQPGEYSEIRIILPRKAAFTA
jgi:GAF domain-containing protein